VATLEAAPEFRDLLTEYAAESAIEGMPPPGPVRAKAMTPTRPWGMEPGSRPMARFSFHGSSWKAGV